MECKLSEMNSVACVLRCHAAPGNAAPCEALLQDLLEAGRQFSGCVFVSLIPPATPQEPYQLVQGFATPADLQRWQTAPEHAQWRERLERVACGAASSLPLHGLQTWSAPPLPAPIMVPPKWKLTVVSWLGIFPLVAVSLGLLGPLLQSWPYLARIFVVTVLVVSLMSYVVMPRLVVWMGWWLRRR